MLNEFVEFIISQSDIDGKQSLARLTSERFNLTKDRVVYYPPSFAVRFCSANTSVFQIQYYHFLLL